MLTAVLVSIYVLPCQYIYAYACVFCAAGARNMLSQLVTRMIFTYLVYYTIYLAI
jgi:hypothetical protein